MNHSLITKGEWARFNLTDIFSNTHEKGKGDVLIADCMVHKKITDDDREMGVKEQEANAHAIVTAVNNTYKKGIDPEAVPDMKEALMIVYEELVEEGIEDEFPLSKVKEALAKAGVKTKETA